MANIKSAAGFFADYLRHLGLFAAMLLLILLACSLKGEIVLLTVLVYKTIGQEVTHNDTSLTQISWETNCSSVVTNISYTPILPRYLQLPDHYCLQDFLLYITLGVSSSLLMYHAACGFLQINYYILQRDSPDMWKCQPNRFLTASNELHEIAVGTMNMTIGGAVSGFLACWVMNDRYSTFYFNIDQHGYPYFFFSFLLIFFWIEATAYYAHKLLHVPFFYRIMHKQHHRYHSPTPYSLVSMSPIEMLFLHSLFLIPVFTIPVHTLVFIANELYVFYYGLLDHSGIKMEALWPWQPNTTFHDDHHKHFHCNFGFNMYLFDYLHGTLRREDRVYGEDVFGGKGKLKDN